MDGIKKNKLNKDKEFLKYGADETNVTQAEVARAGHDFRNHYQKAGEPYGPLSNRDLSKKKDNDNLSDQKLQQISARDKQPSCSQLAKWQKDQKVAKQYYDPATFPRPKDPKQNKATPTNNMGSSNSGKGKSALRNLSADGSTITKPSSTSSAGTSKTNSPSTTNTKSSNKGKSR